MRVLLLSDASNPHTVRWATSLAKRGLEISLFSFYACSERIFEEYRACGIEVHSLHLPKNLLSGGVFKKWPYLFALPCVLRLIKKFKPDLLHAHYASSYGLVGALTGFSPFIISVWGMDVYEFPQASFINRKILEFNLSRASRVLSTSFTMKHQTEKYTDKEVSVTPFGVDVGRFKPERVESFFAPSDLVVGTVKTLEEKYGVEYLIRAFRIVCDRNPELPLRLLIVGGGSLEQTLKEMVNKLELQDRTIFTGRVAHSDVQKYHNMLDVAVFLSVTPSESFGVSVIEAGACGKPVVVSNTGGLPEVVEDGVTGFVVPVRDPVGAARKIETLLLDRSLREKMGENARKRVIEKYEWNSNVDLMISIYRAVCEENTVKKQALPPSGAGFPFNLLERTRRVFPVPEVSVPGGNFRTRMRKAIQLSPYIFSRSGSSMMPETIFLSVNSSCNMKYVMCDIGTGLMSTFSKNMEYRSGHELPLKTAMKLIDEVCFFRPKIAAVSTEPLLYRPLGELCGYARKKGLDFHVTTNGLLLEERSQELIESGLTSLAVSIDAAGVKHDRIRGIPGAFRKISRGLEKFIELSNKKRSGVRERSTGIFLSVTVSSFNAGDILKLYEYFSYWPLDHIVFSHLNFITAGMARDHNLIAPPECRVTCSTVSIPQNLLEIDSSELFRNIEMIKKRAKKKGALKVCFIPDLKSPQEIEEYYRRHTKIFGRGRCFVPWTAVQITPSGDVIPLARCFNLKLGNIEENSFVNIWNGEKARNFRKLIRETGLLPACRRCCGALS